MVFVPFTAPGDHVRVKLATHRPRYAHAIVDKLLEPSSHRTDPVCPVYGSCGGCAWQHVSYRAQLDAKAKRATAALERIGGLIAPAALDIVPSPSPYGYRSRSRVLVTKDGVGYRRRRSHVLCATRRCPLLVDVLDARLAQLSDDPPAEHGDWELAYGWSEEAGARARATLHGAPAALDHRLWLPVDDAQVAFSPGVFVQSNAGFLEPLAHAVGDAAGTGQLALDLFCGAGFLTVGLVRRFEEVVAVEANPVAAEDLRANLDAIGAKARIFAESLEEAIAHRRFAGLQPDAIVLDPPRTGLPKGAAEYLTELDPERIVYLSCDPATLARDLSHLCHRGYRLAGVEGFDLFPQTPHVELLAHIIREGP